MLAIRPASKLLHHQDICKHGMPFPFCPRLEMPG